MYNDSTALTTVDDNMTTLIATSPGHGRGSFYFIFLNKIKKIDIIIRYVLQRINAHDYPGL